MSASYRPRSTLRVWAAVLPLAAASLFAQGSQTVRGYPVLQTPLPQEVLTLLANEISGQTIFNNEVILAGAPWIRAIFRVPRGFRSSLPGLRLTPTSRC